ncbi:hypothetical protein DRO54_10415 [Candidatus Bathyarchaeota archaeon]|nr:MAG: hypothetical protein DRO54_10415 [Candidatus Bathyarchaeota archaeon]
MVNACDCLWSKEQAKALITFLIAEKKRHERDVRNIENSIERIRKKYNLTKQDISECEVLAWLFVEF